MNSNQKTYQIVYVRWIRGSTQNGEYLVSTSTRIKEARGMCRSNFFSHMEMMINHNYPFDEYEIDLENNWIALADDVGLWYYAQFYVKET